MTSSPTKRASPSGIIDLREALKAPNLPIKTRVQWLGKLASDCARAGMTDEGLANAKSAIELAQQHNLPQGKAEALNAASMCHYFRGDHLMAIACGIDAYQAFSTTSDYAQMGHALTTVAASCKDINAYDLAEQALRGCLNIADQLGDNFLKARTQNMLGIMLGHLRRFDEADAILKAAADSLFLLGNKEHVPKIIANRGNVYKKRATHAIASAASRTTIDAYLREGIKFVEASLSVAHDMNNQFEIADKTGSLGEYHFLLGEYDAAERFVATALNLGRALDHPHLITESLLFLGRIAQAKNNLEDAYQWLKQGLEFAKQRDVKVLQPNLHHEFATLLGKMGREQEAQNHTETARTADAALLHLNRDIEREVRLLWQSHFSHHPLLKKG